DKLTPLHQPPGGQSEPKRPATRPCLPSRRVPGRPLWAHRSCRRQTGERRAPGRPPRRADREVSTNITRNPCTGGQPMLESMVLTLSLLAAGHVGTTTIFGHSSWDRSNPHSRLACYRRDISDRDLIIAHNTLPCGTRVWLFSPRTGLSTIA